MSQILMGDFRQRSNTATSQSSVSVRFRGEEGDQVRLSTSQPASGRSTQRNSTDDPPSYRDAISTTSREEPSLQSPLLHVDSAVYPKTRTSFSTAAEDLLEDQNTDLEGDSVCERACVTECCSIMGCIRLVVLLCNAIGFGLLYWEYVYYNSLGQNADYRERKKVGLRLGFGCVILFFAYPVYLGDVFYSSETFRGLLKIVSKADLQAHLDSVAQGRPVVRWQMKCFHQDNRTVTITLPDGTSRTEHHNEKVIAWSGEEVFQFRAWEDVSPGDQLSKSGSYQTVTFHKKYVLADEKTKTTYLAQKEAFINSNRRRDQEYSIEETFEVEGFQPTMLARTSSLPSVTLNPCLYILFAFAFLGQLWSCIIRLGERRVSYTHIKKLSV